MDKQRLKDEIKVEVTHLFEKALDFGEVAIGDGGNYRAFRSKILRIGNGCIRELHKWVDDHWEPTYPETAYQTIVANIEMDLEEPEPIEIPLPKGDDDE